jgi:hypothetical protein
MDTAAVEEYGRCAANLQFSPPVVLRRVNAQLETPLALSESVPKQ